MSNPVTTRYEIRDASGAFVAVHERIDEDGDKRLLWRLPDGTNGLGGIPLADLPLYGAHRLGDWSSGDPVVVTEGEKAAQALVDVGVNAVGTVTGASSTPSRSALAELNGRHVVLWPDADDVGTAHMRRVAAGLRGIAATLWWLDWSDAPPHGDAADYVVHRTREQVHEFIRSCGPVPTDEGFDRRGLGYVFRSGQAEFAFDRIAKRGGEFHGELTVRWRGSEIEDGHLLQARFNASSLTTRGTYAKALRDRFPALKVDWAATLERFCVQVLAAEREGEPFVQIGRRPKRPAIPYLLHPMLPEGKPTILFGEGGSGKSTIATAIATSVASGRPVVDWWTVRAKRDVLVLDWESDVDEWNDRVALLARGAGIEPPTLHYRACVGALTDQVEDVARYVGEHNVGLIIVDSVGMASPTNREGSDANESAIRLFAALRHVRATSLLIDHVPKSSLDSDRGAHNPYGSVFKTNLARSTYELIRAEDVDDDLAHIGIYNRKSNATAKVAPVGVCIEYGDDYIRLDREEIDDERLAAALPLDRRIESVLHDGPLAPKEIADALGASGSNVRAILHRFMDRKFARLDDGRWGLYYPAA